MDRSTSPRRRTFAHLVFVALALAWYTTGAGGQTPTSDYRIGPRDVLRVSVWGQTEVSGQFAVASDGTLNFPLLGRIRAAGLTLRSVEEELTRRLADGFLTDPQVAVSVEVYRSQRVVVMGEVRNAGTYPLSGEMNVLEALVLAGSPTPDAGHEVLIVRSRPGAPGAQPSAPSPAALDAHGEPVENASTSIVRIDLLQLQQGLATDNIMLQDGDTLFVPRAEMFFVFGHVRSPGAYPVRRGMTVVQALALAGGVTDRGATNRIRIIRHEKEIRVGLDDRVQARDTIRVPERVLLMAPEAVIHRRRCLIIGEVAQAHDGSLGLAHAYIDAVANAGADAIKFQTHLASAESTVDEPWRVKFSVQDGSRFEYWRRMEFSEPQWTGLKRHACERGLLFLSSPFSMEAVALLERVGVAAWKVASGEASNMAMLDRMAASRLPVLLSSGLSSQAELDAAVRQIQSHGAPVTVLQTTSAYPCPPEKVGLNMLGVYRARYGCDVGLSDHSGTIFPSLAAATLGVEVIEVHVTMSREMFGPDVTASVTTSELRQLIDGVRFIERMNDAPVDKDTMALDLSPMRQLFTKSLALRMDLPAGTILQEEHLASKKPGTGLPPSRLPDVLGRRLARSVRSDTLLREGDLVEERR